MFIIIQSIRAKSNDKAWLAFTAQFSLLEAATTQGPMINILTISPHYYYYKSLRRQKPRNEERNYCGLIQCFLRTKKRGVPAGN